MKRAWGTTTDKILKALKSLGPMTSAEVCEAIGIERSNVSTIMTRMSHSTKLIPKRIYIAKWTYDAEGMRRYPRPIYALGNQINAQRPKASHKENRRRYESNLRKRMTGNSVFNLGMTRNQYMAIKRGTTEHVGAC